MDTEPLERIHQDALRVLEETGVRCASTEIRPIFESAAQHADFGIARRFLCMAMFLTRTSQSYIPLDLRNAHIEPNRRADYLLSMWPYLKDKWSKIGALDMALAKDKLLGQ